MLPMAQVRSASDEFPGENALAGGRDALQAEKRSGVARSGHRLRTRSIFCRLRFRLQNRRSGTSPHGAHMDAWLIIGLILVAVFAGDAAQRWWRQNAWKVSPP